MRRELCWLANETQRQNHFKDTLSSNFCERVTTATCSCPHCNAAESMQPVSPSIPIMYVTIQGHITVSLPQCICPACGHQLTVHPFEVGCFPATPARAEVWYDKQVLMFTSACQVSGPTAIQAHCSALQELHMLNGCGPGKPSVWQHIANASQQWRRLQVWLLTLHCMLQ